jgi:hypothetical protein
LEFHGTKPFADRIMRKIGKVYVVSEIYHAEAEGKEAAQGTGLGLLRKSVSLRPPPRPIYKND